MRFPKPNNIVAEKYVAGMSLFKSKLAKIKLSANESALGPSPKARKQRIPNQLFENVVNPCLYFCTVVSSSSSRRRRLVL